MNGLRAWVNWFSRLLIGLVIDLANIVGILGGTIMLRVLCSWGTLLVVVSMGCLVICMRNVCWVVTRVRIRSLLIRWLRNLLGARKFIVCNRLARLLVSWTWLGACYRRLVLILLTVVRGTTE